MTYDEAVRFITASNHALSRAGTDNRVVPLLHIAAADWPAFVAECMQRFSETSRDHVAFNNEDVSEIGLLGAVVRKK